MVRGRKKFSQLKKIRMAKKENLKINLVEYSVINQLIISRLTKC